MDNIQQARALATRKDYLPVAPKIFNLMLTQLREHHNLIKQLKGHMDKQIHKVERDINKGNKKKAKKDVKKLLKMDKKFDAKIVKADKVLKKLPAKKK